MRVVDLSASSAADSMAIIFFGFCGNGVRNCMGVADASNDVGKLVKTFTLFKKFVFERGQCYNKFWALFLPGINYLILLYVLCVGRRIF